ncbi:MAG TPA: hypothetical protein DIC49_06465 [Gammaproteobacteria bacterium]|nr:hypothetical protein [Gammaproteobacteria bacterium]
MTDISEEEVASRPIGMAILLGLLTGCLSHELILSFAPQYLWSSLAAFIPGFYLLRIWIKTKLKSMNVIESDDLTFSRKLGGKVSYSESFSNICTLVFLVCFLIITVGGNLIAIRFPEESASIFNLIDLVDRILL